MIKTIFRNTFLVGMSVLLLCAILFFAIRYTQTIDDAYNELSLEAQFILTGFMEEGETSLAKAPTESRITWIDSDGKVLYDSVFGTDIANQGETLEVMDAMENGYGRQVRFSESSSEETVYYAVRCADSTVLRLGRAMSAVMNALSYISPMIWILVIVLVISGVLSYRAARQIVKPINAIDPDNPGAVDYPELAPLIGKLWEQQLTIQEEKAGREQMRREFSINMSNELQAPLTTISERSERIADGDLPAEKMKEYAEDINKESRRRMSLVNDIIRLSQLDEENFENSFEEVDLYAMCAEVTQQLKEAADAKGIRILLQGRSVYVKAVPALLSEMIYNMCDNAIKYNRPYGSVRVEVSESEEGVSVNVADTGIGIASEHKDRIFERFYRVDKSHSREIGGTGLGLSIVKHGAQVHNAAVEISSVPDEGTRISLTFPNDRQKQTETDRK